MRALLDADSDMYLINYRNVKCLPSESDSIKESEIRVRGVTGVSSVVGKVEFEYESHLNEKSKVSTEPSILRICSISI